MMNSDFFVQAKYTKQAKALLRTKNIVAPNLNTYLLIGSLSWLICWFAVGYLVGGMDQVKEFTEIIWFPIIAGAGFAHFLYRRALELYENAVHRVAMTLEMREDVKELRDDLLEYQKITRQMLWNQSQ